MTQRSRPDRFTRSDQPPENQPYGAYARWTAHPKGLRFIPRPKPRYRRALSACDRDSRGVCNGDDPSLDHLLFFMTARRARSDRMDATDKAEPIQKADPKDPIEPTEQAEPIEPIESTEPLEAIERNESSDQSDHFDVFDRAFVVTRRIVVSGGGTR